MFLREESFQLFAPDNQVALVADNHAVVFKLDQKFGDARPRRAHQIRQILVPRRDRDRRATRRLTIARPELV